MPRLVNEHVHCVQCRYDLYGVPRAGLCPECGYSIDETMRRSPEASELNTQDLRLNDAATRQAQQQEGYERRARRAELQLDRYDQFLDALEGRERRINELLDRFDRLLTKWEQKAP